MNRELALAAASMRNVDLFVVSFNGGVLDIFNVHLTAIWTSDLKSYNPLIIGETSKNFEEYLLYQLRPFCSKIHRYSNVFNIHFTLT